jgi:hypothetical protein
MKKAGSILFAVAFLFYNTTTLFSGTTGKISGFVTDAQTGEKLLSANVLIEGTTTGAATNLEGYYVILNVPPGTYRVTASLLGYQSVTMIDVRVDIDQTTNLDFRLREEMIEGEEVIVVATRPVVQKDVSASRANITAAEVQSLPVAQVASVVGLQAGIQVTSDNKFVIRGGAADQTAFLINGLSLRDGRDNTPYTGISLTSIEDVQVQTGGWNAEYGNIRSGLVNVVTKEGGSNAYTFAMFSRYRPEGPKHFGMHPHDRNSYWIRPYVDPAVAWTGTENGVWDEYTRRQYERFEGWNSVSQKTLLDSDPNNDLTPEAAQRLFLWEHRRVTGITLPDYDVDMSFGGPFPELSSLGNLRFFASYRQSQSAYLLPLSRDAYREYNGQIKITSDVSQGMKLTIEGLVSRSTGTNDNNAGLPGLFTTASTLAAQMNRVSFIDTRIFATDYWAPSVIKRNMIGAKLAHVLSSSMYYSASLHRFETEYGTGPGRLRDIRPLNKFGNNYYADEAPFGFQPDVSTGINGMRMGVGMSNSRDSSVVAVYTFRFDMTSQLDRFNEVKAGAEFIYTDNQVNYASVDARLLSGRSRSQWHTFPKQGAIYLQDKLEFEGMIANLGVRLDYSHAGGAWFSGLDRYDIRFSDARSLGLDSLLSEPTDHIFTLSPRLGVSFPVTEVSKIYFNYGHFRSLPAPEDLFLIRRFSDTYAITRIADPNKPFPRTIQYELGYEHSLLDEYLLRVAAYYKDVSGESFLVRYTGGPNNAVNYQVSTPNRYRDIRGFEFTAAKNRGQWVQGFINYTYDVRTTGYFGLSQYFENRGQQREFERTNVYQEKPVPQPFARANIDIYSPEDFGPQVLGHHVFGDIRVNLVGSWASGFYFTWTGGGQAAGVENNVQWKDTYNVNMRFSKNFRVGRANLQFFMDVSNLFNFKFMNSLGFVTTQDYEEYIRSLHLPAEIAGDVYTPKFGYLNFAGNDRPGEYRRNGAAFTPMVAVENISNVSVPAPSAIYFDKATGAYMSYVNGAWAPVDQARLQQVLDDKAYIDMPNQEWFAFLNPRNIFYGIRFSFDI